MSTNPTSRSRPSLAETQPVPKRETRYKSPPSSRRKRQRWAAVPHRPNPAGSNLHPGIFGDHRDHVLACCLWFFAFLVAEFFAGYLLYRFQVMLDYILLCTFIDMLLVIKFYDFEMQRREVVQQLFLEVRRPSRNEDEVSRLTAAKRTKDWLVWAGWFTVAVVAIVKIGFVVVADELPSGILVFVVIAYVITALINMFYNGEFFRLLYFVSCSSTSSAERPVSIVKVLKIPPGSYVRPEHDNEGHLLETFADGSARLVIYGLLTAGQLDRFLFGQTSDVVTNAIALAGMEAQIAMTK